MKKTILAFSLSLSDKVKMFVCNFVSRECFSDRFSVIELSNIQSFIKIREIFVSNPWKEFSNVFVHVFLFKPSCWIFLKILFQNLFLKLSFISIRVDGTYTCSSDFNYALKAFTLYCCFSAANISFSKAHSAKILLSRKIFEKKNPFLVCM